MALRSLYTLVATAVNTLEYIKPSVALVLAFVGAKMIAVRTSLLPPTHQPTYPITHPPTHPPTSTGVLPHRSAHLGLLGRGHGPAGWGDWLECHQAKERREEGRQAIRRQKCVGCTVMWRGGWKKGRKTVYFSMICRLACGEERRKGWPREGRDASHAAWQKDQSKPQPTEKHELE